MDYGYEASNWKLKFDVEDQLLKNWNPLLAVTCEA